MAIDNLKRDKIAEVIKNILVSRIETFPELNHQNRNAPFHGLILKAFDKQLHNLSIPTPYLVAISS
ncbi:hypothetical protein M1615_03255 [Patescibacteria group bacterium]|nr:hypothetical protein [Patescibacteria group bacterium]